VSSGVSAHVVERSAVCSVYITAVSSCSNSGLMHALLVRHSSTVDEQAIHFVAILDDVHAGFYGLVRRRCCGVLC
jgi:hypothetical protein